VVTAEQNVRLTRVGPGTPAGNLFRRYWQPAVLSEEVSEKDGPPVRVRLLGEDLLAFRDSDGIVALVDAFCPHRRAPFFFGRNEECGIRCAYHGWKFDRNGDCVDLPTEPGNERMKANLKITAYPTVERGGIVWAYMGPADQKPPPPDYEWLRVPHSHLHVSKTYEECNYLQALEGGLDTAHSSYAHNNNMSAKSDPRLLDKSPRLDVNPTEYGYNYVSTRQMGGGDVYIRLYHYVMPFQQMRGGIHEFSGKRRANPAIDGHLWVPIDDETTFVYNWHHAYDETTPLSEEHRIHTEYFYGRGPDDMIPGTHQLKKNKRNDYMIDRELQKTKVFTGITGINTQDFALQEGMGPIVDRSKEHLGSTDRAIIAMRSMLLRAIDAVEAGEAAPGVMPESHRDMRPYDDFVRAGQDWRAVFDTQTRAKW
jgi:phenylpropionate dioxygenase-like ring-hydroxylating dioxygenase large terminal subunit